MNTAATWGALSPDLPDVKLMNIIAAALVSCMLLGLLIGWLLRQPVLAIGHITIEGQLQRTSIVALRTNLTPHLLMLSASQSNFFTMDLQAVRQVFEQMPWIRHAHVHRQFPGSLRIQLQEYNPVARWGGPHVDTFALVDSDGLVFNPGDDGLEPAGLPYLQGPPGYAGEMLKMLNRLHDAMQPLEWKIDTLWYTNLGRWRVRLTSGAVLELGGDDNDPGWNGMLQRVQYFKNTVMGILQQQGGQVDDLEYVDLRYLHGYALRLRDITSREANAPAVAKKLPAARN